MPVELRARVWVRARVRVRARARVSRCGLAWLALLNSCTRLKPMRARSRWRAVAAHSDADVPFIVVATKIDRVKRSKQKAHLGAIAKGLGMDADQIIPFSSTEKQGLDLVWSVLLDVVGEFDWPAAG